MHRPANTSTSSHSHAFTTSFTFSSSTIVANASNLPLTPTNFVAAGAATVKEAVNKHLPLEHKKQRFIVPASPGNREACRTYMTSAEVTRKPPNSPKNRRA